MEAENKVNMTISIVLKSTILEAMGNTWWSCQESYEIWIKPTVVLLLLTKTNACVNLNKAEINKIQIFDEKCKL